METSSQYLIMPPPYKLLMQPQERPCEEGRHIIPVYGVGRAREVNKLRWVGRVGAACSNSQFVQLLDIREENINGAVRV